MGKCTDPSVGTSGDRDAGGFLQPWLRPQALGLSLGVQRTSGLSRSVTGFGGDTSAGHKGHQCWERGHPTVLPRPWGRGILRGCHGAGWLLHPCGMGTSMPLAPGDSLGDCPAHPSASFCRRSCKWRLSNCLIVHPREKLSLRAGAPVQPVAMPTAPCVLNPPSATMPGTSHP